MTSKVLLDALLPLVADLSRQIDDRERYRRLLQVNGKEGGCHISNNGIRFCHIRSMTVISTSSSPEIANLK